MQILKGLLTITMMVSVYNSSRAAEPLRSSSSDSASLLDAARAEIAYEKQTGSQETACDLYLEKVLQRAGYNVEHFLANDFDEVAHRDLPSWQPKDFFRSNTADDRASLETFLNNSPDHTAFLAQWIRTGPHGHVAIVVKEATNTFTIYQAQLGLSGPAEKPVTIDGLLYMKSDRGDRGHLRLFFE